MDFEPVLQPIPEYIRWVTEKGELHYLTLEKTTHLIRENCEIASSNDLLWPWRILDTFFYIDPEPLEEMLKQLSILSWLSVESANKYLNARKRNLRSPSVRTWRGKPGENICCINCVAELNKNAKLIMAPYVVSITPQSMFMVAGENSMEELRAILQESEAKLEMKNFNPPSFFCVEVGYLGG